MNLKGRNFLTLKDFTPEEIEECRAAGFIPVTMGDNRLRTETAALVGCDTIHIINQAFT